MAGFTPIIPFHWRKVRQAFHVVYCFWNKQTQPVSSESRICFRAVSSALLVMSITRQADKALQTILYGAVPFPSAACEGCDRHARAPSGIWQTTHQQRRCGNPHIAIGRHRYVIEYTYGFRLRFKEEPWTPFTVSCPVQIFNISCGMRRVTMIDATIFGHFIRRINKPNMLPFLRAGSIVANLSASCSTYRRQTGYRVSVPLLPMGTFPLLPVSFPSGCRFEVRKICAHTKARTRSS